MVYIFAAIGVITVAVLLWRLFAAQQVGVGTRNQRTVAPDDDPEFLRKLGEEQRKPRRDDDS